MLQNVSTYSLYTPSTPKLVQSLKDFFPESLYVANQINGNGA